jgi:hypothetical protein
MSNTRSTKMRGFGSLLTKFYLSKVVQRGTMKQGGNPRQNLTADRCGAYKMTLEGSFAF